MRKTTPKFGRTRYMELFDKKMIFISGIASILGIKTVGVSDAVEQTEITIQNIEQLFSEKVLQEISDKKFEPRYGHTRVYIKNRKDFAAIKNTFQIHFNSLSVVYIIADICRNDLLVEIEGKVILVHHRTHSEICTVLPAGLSISFIANYFNSNLALS